MTESIIEQDEAHRAKQREEARSHVDSQVNEEIAENASSASPDSKAEVVEVASQLRASALHETAAGERAEGRGRVAARGSQFLDYAFYVLYSLLAVRLVLSLIAAESSNGFVRLVRAVTGPFYAPFDGIVPSPSAQGGYTLVGPILIALAAYMLLHLGINAALRMVVQRKTEI